MFRRSASLAIPHRNSFAAIPSVSLVLLGHMNRSKGKREKNNGPVFRKVCGFDVSRAVGIARYNATKFVVFPKKNYFRIIFRK